MKERRPFAWVEPKDGGKDEDGMVPYFKLLAANMVVAEGFSEDELQEMADAMNSALEARCRGLVEALEYFADRKKWGWDSEKRATFDAYKLDGLDLAKKTLEDFRK